MPTGIQSMQDTMLESGDPAPAVPSNRALSRGDQIGRFVVLSLLGAGGMGEVYLCFDPELDRRVAVKVLRARGGSQQDDDQARARLLREARAIARLSHPNVVAIHDVAVWRGRVFLAMEHVAGQTLGAYVAGLKGDWRRIIEVFTGAGEGLIAAHQAGLVHRDFKPDNVLVEESGRARVLDFGIARASDDSEDVAEESDSSDTIERGFVTSGSHSLLSLTMTGAAVGTPAYMAPEQFMGRDIDARTDQFCFCVALWEALYGARPFTASTTAELAAAVADGRISSDTGQSDAPPEIEKALRRGLSPKASERFPSMRELLDALAPPPVEASRSSTLWVAWIFAALAAAVLLAWLTAKGADPIEACVGGPELLRDAWGEQEQQRARDAFVALGGEEAGADWDRTAGAVSRWVDRWFAERRRACEATHREARQSAATLELRLACLMRQRAELAALAELWHAPDLQIRERAFEAAGSLPRPEACADAGSRPGHDVQLSPAKEAERARVRDALPHARAWIAAGKYSEALAAIDAVLETARGQDDPALLAQTLLLRGRSQEMGGTPLEARVTLREALAIALAAKDFEIALQSATSLITNVGTSLSRHEEGESFLIVAQGLSKAVPLGIEHLDLERAACGYYNDRSKLDLAEESCQRSIDLAAELVGKDSLQYAFALRGLGITYIVERDAAAALKLLEEDWEIETRLIGDKHPRLVRAANARAMALQLSGDLEGSMAWLDRAFAIAVGAHGPDTAETLFLRINMAAVSLERGDWARAEQESETLARTYAATKGAGASENVWIELVRSQLAVVRGDLADALKHAELELSFAVATRAADHPEVANAQLDIIDVRLRIGQLDDLPARIDDALGAAQRAGDPAYQARAHLLRARFALASGQPQDAIAALDQTRSLDESTFGPAFTAELLAWRGAAMQRLPGQEPEGKKLWTQGRAVLEATPSKGVVALQAMDLFSGTLSIDENLQVRR